MTGGQLAEVHEVPDAQVQLLPIEMLQWNGTGSLPVPSFQSFFEGSPPIVYVTVGGLTVLSTSFVPVFQVPKTADGVIGVVTFDVLLKHDAVPPHCQSPALLWLVQVWPDGQSASAVHAAAEPLHMPVEVVSVTKSAGVGEAAGPVAVAGARVLALTGRRAGVGRARARAGRPVAHQWGRFPSKGRSEKKRLAAVGP